MEAAHHAHEGAAAGHHRPDQIGGEARVESPFAGGFGGEGAEHVFGRRAFEHERQGWFAAVLDSGNRFETYIFRGERGSGVIGVNGAAARLTAVGNRVIVMSFCHLTLEELKLHRPKVVICTPDNRIAEQLSYDPD